MNSEPEAKSLLERAAGMQLSLLAGTKDNPQETLKAIIADLENAVQLGLSGEDTVYARWILADSHFDLLPKDDRNRQNLMPALEQLEKAVLLDAQQKDHFFGKPHNRTQLMKFDVVYLMMGIWITKEQGADAAITYYEQKLRLFDYLPTSPLLRVLQQTGGLYANEKGDKERACAYFQRIINADPVEGGEGENEIRRLARQSLQILSKSDVGVRQMKGEIENPPKKGTCFVATAAYGSPLAPEVILLSRFRDDVLLNSMLGRAFVSSYYRVSPPLASLIARADFLRAATRHLFLAPILRLLRATKFGSQPPY